MKIIIFIVAVLLIIALIAYTRHLWDRPKDTVDMIKKFDTILQKGYTLGEGGRLLELRENFIKVGVRDHNGEKAYMIKQRPGNEFRVIYNSEYDPEFQDLNIQHIYKDDEDQNKILEQFEKEISEALVARKK